MPVKDNNNVSRQAGPEAMYWLCGGMALCLMPHLRHVPLWIMAMAAGLILWRLGGEFRHRPLPVPRYYALQRVNILLALAGCAGIFVHYHTLVGREAGTALLVLLAGLKILETRSSRDFYVSVFLGFFVTVANFFYSQSIFTALYMVVAVLALTSALIAHNDRGQTLKAAGCIRLAGGMLAQAAPVMLVLFLLFPRISGPLWGLPRDAYAGLTGLSDSMEPGIISQLAQSREVAFRVQFDGPVPDRAGLYWRGPVLTYDDGRKWTRSSLTYSGPRQLQTAGTPVHYTVTQEPTDQRFLFALEMPEQAPPQGYFTGDYQLLAREPLQQRIRYELSSYTDYQLGKSNPFELQRALQLPRGAHVRAVALARNWRAGGDEPAAIIRRVLGMFSRESFYYTLAPPLLTGDNVDEFLFGTRQGFCEHYAAAFVVLMRAAGIPARVVTGYQGGEFNPVGNYFIVYQRDAHAWAEVWLDDRGWVRIDPTAAVAPERILQGTGGATLVEFPAVFGRRLISRDLMANLSQVWDAVNNQWNQLVISYGPKKQTRLLEQFGLRELDFGMLSLVLAAAVGILLIIVTIWLRRGVRAPARDQARLLYDQFCGKLGRIGMRRRPAEGPLDFARRAGKRHKALRGEVDEITRLYILARYASQNEQLAALRRRVRSFRLSKSKSMGSVSIDL